MRSLSSCSLLVFLFAVAGSAFGENQLIPPGMLTSCPKPFAGVDNFSAKLLNEHVVSLVANQGAAPSQETVRAALKAAQGAVAEHTLDKDIGSKGVAAIEGALEKGVQINKGTLFAKGCRMDFKKYKDALVGWMRSPCEPVVMLFQTVLDTAKFVCITDKLYVEAAE